MRADQVTQKHIERVRELLQAASLILEERAIAHDQSKFDPVESEPLQRMQDLIDAEGQAPYGSDEYKRRTAMLGPMLANHYAKNSHHPEHYENGVDGMCLFDVIEMFFDWKAASERGGDSAMGISHAIDRFKFSPQLATIFRNTANSLGFKHT